VAANQRGVISADSAGSPSHLVAVNTEIAWSQDGRVGNVNVSSAMGRSSADSTRTPVSSFSSRAAAWLVVSPGSTCPPMPVMFPAPRPVFLSPSST
jgi:hypothetical protein